MSSIDKYETLTELLESRVKASPSDIAFSEKDAAGSWQAISWKQFNTDVGNLSAKLFNAGLQPGDQVGILMPNSIHWETIQHAVLRLGGVVIGLDLNDPPGRMREVFSLCSLRHLFVDNTSRLKQIPDENLKNFKLIITATTDNDTNRGLPIKTIPELNAASQSFTNPSVTGDMKATIIFTSGTTGHPKSLSYSHKQLSIAVQAIVPFLHVLPNQTHSAAWLPLANPFQRIINLIAIDLNWKTFLVPAPGAIMATVNEINPHFFPGVPRFYEKLHQGIEQNIARMPGIMQRLAHWAKRTGKSYKQKIISGGAPSLFLTLKYGIANTLVLKKIRSIIGQNEAYFISGSAPLSKEIIKDFEGLGWNVLEAYGVSENIIPMAMNVPGFIRHGSVGRPFAENDIKIDEHDEISVKSPGLALELAPTTDNGYYKTGDIGTLDKDGYLWLTGRKSDMFKLSTGRKIIPGAVEHALKQIDGVEHSIAAGKNKKYVVALLNIPEAKLKEMHEKHSGPSGTRKYLRDQAKEACAHLPHYSQPADVLIVSDSFTPHTGELTANLKLRRSFILEKYNQDLEKLYQEIGESQ